jgi:hypothetical protein
MKSIEIKTCRSMSTERVVHNGQKRTVGLLVRMALVGALWAAFGAPTVAAQSCIPLTLDTISTYLASGQSAFEIDDEGLTATPLYFDLIGQPNPTTGAFKGAISTAPQTPQTNASYYPLTGTLAQVGSSGLSISFTYSPQALTAYHYTGAIAVAGQSCNLFLAGVFTQTTTVVSKFGVSATISGPYAFSAKLVVYNYQ